MKKIFGLVMILCFMLACSLPVNAEKTDWADSSYNFSNVQRVLVHDIKFKDTAEMPNDLLPKILQEDYLKNASRSRYQMIRDSQENADIYVTAEVLKWHDDYYIKPEYTTWEKREMTRTKKHKDGSKSVEKYYVSVPVVHPPERVDTSTVRIRFDVYDVKTGNVVMSRDEERVRDHSKQGEKGIFGRITKSFFEDLEKKIKHK